MTPREIAEQIVEKGRMIANYEAVTFPADALIDAIEIALLAERERAAKIAEESKCVNAKYALIESGWDSAAESIATAIRTDGD